MPQPGQLHISNAAALLLLESGCVRAHVDAPVRLRSDLLSPVAIDCRQLLVYPRMREALVRLSALRLGQLGVLGQVDAVAVADAQNLVFAGELADALGLAALQVRAPREGAADIGGLELGVRRVLLVDDVLVTGQAKAACARVLRSRGMGVDHVFTLFSVAAFGARNRLDDLGIDVHSLTDWSTLLETARRVGTFDAAALRAFLAFVRDPSGWSAAHGGTETPRRRAVQGSLASCWASPQMLSSAQGLVA